MPESPEFRLLEVPARIADLAFRLAVPSDWNLPELPAEEVDFSAPAAFFPLLLAVAPWGAVVLTVAARPGFGDGTLQDWAMFLLSSQELRPTAFGPVALGWWLGPLQGLGGVARQQQEGMWLEYRFAFLEDGGRLVQIGLLAPEAISASLEPVWQAAMESFALARPQGPSVPLGAGAGMMPEAKAEAEAPPPAEPPGPAPDEAVAAANANQTASDVPVPPEFTDADLGYYAKAADPSALDPEHPINARLRDQGVGLVPNVLEVDSAAKSARVGAGAIRALIGVAFGWHVIDDGRRTVVLDPDGKIQINLSVIPLEGRTIDQLLDSFQAEALESYADPEFLRVEHDGIWALAVRRIAVNGEPIEQLHMLTRWADDRDLIRAVLRARVTADPASMRFAADYADVILKSADYGARAAG